LGGSGSKLTESPKRVKERKKEAQPSFEAQSKCVAQHNSPGGHGMQETSRANAVEGKLLHGGLNMRFFSYKEKISKLMIVGIKRRARPPKWMESRMLGS